MSTTTVATIESWLPEPITEKFVLVEMDVGRLQEAWNNERTGVWGHRFDTWKSTYHALGQGNLGYGSLGGSGTFESGNKIHPAAIGSAKGDAVSFTQQGSLASVQANVQSFWYDYDTSKVYVNCTDFNDPAIFTVVLGFTLGLSNKAININNAYYEPKVRGIPMLTKTKDPLFFGIIKHDGGTIETDNHDGFFDNINDDYIFGQPTVILYGGNFANKTMPYANYRKIFTGHNERSNHDYETMTVNVVHNIKRLSQKIPIRKYNQTDFPNLHEDDIGRGRPIPYGQIFHGEVVCVNKKEDSADWVFECGDTTDHASGIMSVTAAYLGGLDLVIKSQNVASGTFTVSETAYLPLSTDKGKKITADWSGYISNGTMITNSADVIKDLNAVYSGIAFVAGNYDLTEWNSEDDDALNCGLYITDEIEVEDAIQQLTLSSFASFIELDDGRFTFRIVDITADADKTISKNMIAGSPSVLHDGTLFLSSCKVGYKRFWDDATHRWLNETTDETDIATKYGKYNEKPFETLLTNATDGQTLVTRIMNYYGKIHPEVMVNVPIEYIDFEIGDIKNIDTDTETRVFMGTVKCEIIGITKNIGLADERDFVTLTGRVI